MVLISKKFQILHLYNKLIEIFDKIKYEINEEMCTMYLCETPL